MLPIPHAAFVTGVFLQDWNLVKDKDAYIILTADEGIVFKVVENKLREYGTLRLHSLNPVYEPYDLQVNNIREIWQFVHYISPKIPENQENENKVLMESVKKLKKDVQEIQTRLQI
jgi:hypothetical protein